MSVFSDEHCYCGWREYVHNDVMFNFAKLVLTSFPGSSLFLPRESTLVATGHVPARFLQIPEKWLEGGAGQL